MPIAKSIWKGYAVKVALIGASGNAGSQIAAELSMCGHIITAIARDISNIA